MRNSRPPRLDVEGDAGAMTWATDSGKGRDGTGSRQPVGGYTRDTGQRPSSAASSIAGWLTRSCASAIAESLGGCCGFMGRSGAFSMSTVLKLNQSSDAACRGKMMRSQHESAARNARERERERDRERQRERERKRKRKREREGRKDGRCPSRLT